MYSFIAFSYFSGFPYLLNCSGNKTMLFNYHNVIVHFNILNSKSNPSSLPLVFHIFPHYLHSYTFSGELRINHLVSHNQFIRKKFGSLSSFLLQYFDIRNKMWGIKNQVRIPTVESTCTNFKTNNTFFRDIHT